MVATMMRRSAPRCHVDDAAAGEVAVAHVARHLRVVDPPLLSCHRVQREDASDGCAEIQRAVDVKRGRFERRRPAVLRLVRVAGAKRPGDLQRCDVLAIDGIERREALPTGITPVSRPVSVRQLLRPDQVAANGWGPERKDEDQADE